MKKLLLLAVIIFAVVLPARLARSKDGREGFKKLLIQMVIFDFIYVILITQVWFRLGP